jgi:hypothetical protein
MEGLALNLQVVQFPPEFSPPGIELATLPCLGVFLLDPHKLFVGLDNCTISLSDLILQGIYRDAFR